VLQITAGDVVFRAVATAISLVPVLGVALIVLVAVRSRRSGAKVTPVHIAGDVVLHGHLWRPGDAMSRAWDAAAYGTVVVTAGELL